ncbi:acetyl-CoA carboxylase biotin carboxylase subunit [Roseiarcaceae bacterium H3SJ34-1]|uniref:acetyl/propionyl/methylcrotonyl-CoA carboxylase subunit alpha n=1 Tax=Terripilifer ovatus TaxID=3032367 RepID=UPI003AB9892E|nr:acetyl-CoA carboxylase biotin carboxylase subunit [Roseiarcaceae bacterium H3SJ34-1]
MFTSVLIANRGEIACRIIRTARRLGMRTIAVFSEADRQALHVKMADEAHCIGPSPAALSYLRGDVILDVARACGAQCIHPGYGFLSENAGFAEACAAAGVVFVGPPPSAIRAMGLKDGAKALMRKAGVPVVPGYDGERQEAGFLQEQAARVGYPVLIKAVAGGGGKGMRKVERAEDFAAALASAQREAQASFGNAGMLIEKYVSAPRHIEIQVFTDNHGKAVHLFERDCTLQRRHQKVIEEAPAPGMTNAVRKIMGEAAVAAARAVNYSGAGTVEFIVDGSRPLAADTFWFMEMNTRLQVEHPVTEAITGLDLVEMQFRVAAGEPLQVSRGEVACNGHAIEARLYAEDPETGFLPSTGVIHVLKLPSGEGIRVDAGVDQGGAVTPFYDPMIAKIIAHGATRKEAIARLAEALGKVVVAGPRSNAGFLKALVLQPAFAQGRFDTGFIERHVTELGAVRQPVDDKAVAFGAAAVFSKAQASRASQRDDPWSVADAFQLGAARRMAERILVDGAPLSVDVAWSAAGPAVTFGAQDVIAANTADPELVIVPAGDDVFVLHHGRQTQVSLFDPLEHAGEDAAEGGGTVRSPMHGKLIDVFVAIGDLVQKGSRLAVVEAMKMEHLLVAPVAGRVASISAQAGQQVAQNAPLIGIEILGGEG